MKLVLLKKLKFHHQTKEATDSKRKIGKQIIMNKLKICRKLGA